MIASENGKKSQTVMASMRSNKIYFYYIKNQIKIASPILLYEVVGER